MEVGQEFGILLHLVLSQRVRVFELYHGLVILYNSPVVVHHVREQIEELSYVGQFLNVEVDLTVRRLLLFLDDFVELAVVPLFQKHLLVREVEDVADELLWSQRQGGEVQVHHHPVGYLVYLDVALHIVGVRAVLASTRGIPAQLQVEL